MIARRALLAVPLLASAWPVVAQQRPAPDKATLEAAFKEWGRLNDEWLAENLMQPGWAASPTGLQFKKLNANPKGYLPTHDGTVLIRYTTKLAKAGFIDQHMKEPIEMTVGSLLPGMSEAVQMMHTGETWDFAVPAKLAYGDKVIAEKDGQMKVPPNSALVWHVELVDVFA